MKLYRFIPFVGIIIDAIKGNGMIKNPYYNLYHIVTSVILVLIILFWVYG